MDDTVIKPMQSQTQHVKGPMVEPKGYRELTLKEAARKTPPTLMTDTEALIDMDKMRRYRMARLRAEIRARDLAGVVLGSPHSIRYATGLRNCMIFQAHIPATYLFVPAEGPAVLFDSQPGRFTGQELPTIDEISPDVLPLNYMFAGDRAAEWFGHWAGQIAELVARDGGANRRVAIEAFSPFAPGALAERGLEVTDAGNVVAQARNIKSPEEILCINHVIAVAEDGMARMHANLRAGLTETQLWAYLWQANMEAGGDFMECRLLASGDRTNPWQQEAGSKRIRPGDLVGFDTDMVGPFGYFADISRTFFCGPGRPSDHQKELYKRAHEEITYNMELMQPGMGFREVTEKAFRQPERFRRQHYPALAHGCGMSDEWPVIFYPEDAQFIYDGVLEPGMVMSVESYVGEFGGHEGVKLEQMVLILDDGYELLSTFPYEEQLLG
ncbi:MAG: Xaa-Pro peptidase family protein [Pseudomonadota bacterium]